MNTVDRVSGKEDGILCIKGPLEQRGPLAIGRGPFAIGKVIRTGARQRSEGILQTIDLGDVQIQPSNSVKSLGVTIDSTLSFDAHVDNVCKAAYFHIRALRHVRIPESVALTIASSMVGARLDYCNAVLYGTSKSNIQKLQRVQNSLARIVTGTRRSDRITPVLARLHWLKIADHINYKVALLTFKVVTSQKPNYLFDLIRFNIPVRQLRSSDRQNRLYTGASKTVFASRAFCYAAPTVWNRLPFELTDDLSSLNIFRCKPNLNFTATLSAGDRRRGRSATAVRQ